AYFSFLFLFTFCFGLLAQNASLNLVEVGNLPYSSELNDIWAYVDAQGNEYALVGAVDGVSIVSLSDPANPVELQFMPGANSTWRDLKTFGDYAYVSNETADGLRIIDLSTLPGTVAYKDTIMQGISTIHNLWISQGVLFMLGPDNYNGGAAMFDLNANPWVPSFIGAYDTRYVHDLYGRNDTVYAAEINTGTLTILDISNPANPVQLGSRSYQNSFTHNVWLNDAGNVCFSTDELAEAYIYAWEVSDPTDIKQLDRIRSSLSNGDAIPHNTHVLNDYLVTSYYRDGINIVDASRPHNLVEVGYYDTSPALQGDGFNGSWGAYPFLPSGLVLASDIENGLFVLQPNYVRACYLEGNVTDASNGAPIANATITINGVNLQELSMTNGDYAMGLLQNGPYTVTYSRLGYVSETRTVQLENGVLTIEDVALDPLVKVSMNIDVSDATTNAPIADAQILFVDPNSGELVSDYVTDANGQATDSEIFAITYLAYVARWGYQTIETTVSIDVNNPNLSLSLEPGYYDDFLVDFNWTLLGNATSGSWELGEPEGTSAFGQEFNPDLDFASDFGENAYVTGNGGGNLLDDEVDGGLTVLQSPSMDLSTYNDPILNFQYWLVNLNLATASAGDDFLRVELSDGPNTVTLIEYTGPLNNFWTLSDSFHLKNFLPLTNQMFIRFITQDTGDPTLVEAAIDVFTITEGDTSSSNNTALEDQLLGEKAFSVFPNPSNGQFQLLYDLPAESSQWSISLENLHGQSVLQQELKGYEGTQTIATNLPSGLYLAIIKENGRNRGVRKIWLQ
ncbi:MAG: choice-of-anchor B family protein, partial [Bacteroidota bacterium]